MNSEIIRYIGCDDADQTLFESQYSTPDGMCYNSFVILDEKVAVMDTVDSRKCGEWMENLKAALGGRTPDYLVVQHMEPDHSGSMAVFRAAYPDAVIVASAKAISFMGQLFEDVDFGSAKAVKEGDTLSLGARSLSFVAAPMVHWPEVMMAYCPEEKLLFSADGFGKFGVMNAQDGLWADEAGRYYFNICGKYGAPVSTVLRKASSLDIQTICPLHGPILEGEMLSEALRLYSIWSRYEVEKEGVLVAHASIHGHTAQAARKVAQMLRSKGVTNVIVSDLCREDVALAVENAFRVGKVILCASSYDGDVFPPMHNFLWKLGMKGYQNRKVGIIENGTWAPSAARSMRSLLEPLKNITIVEPSITIKSSMKKSDMPAFEALVDAIIA